MSTDTNAAKPRYEISIGYLENTDQWNVHEITRLAGFEANWSQVVVHSSENLIEGYDYDANEFEIHFSPEMVAVEYDGTSREFGVGTPVFDKCVQFGIYQPVPVQPLAKKPPLTIADLTEEQAIQIAKLAYGEVTCIISDFDVDLVLYDIVTDAPGAVRVGFDVAWSDLSSRRHLVFIHGDFNVNVHSERRVGLRNRCTRNQRAIQKLFTEWGAE